MATRQYTFITGPETPTIPTVSTPGGNTTGINYIGGNFNAEDGTTTGWAAYADAAAATPADGTGGSPTVTFTNTSSSPLIDSNSFLITKDASNRQGEGASFDFTIDSGAQDKSFKIKFYYSASANFVYTGSADIRIFIYDITNATLITPFRHPIRDDYGYYEADFQTAADSTSYRLIFHVATTNALAYTLKIDNIEVGPAVSPLVLARYTSDTTQLIDSADEVIDYEDLVYDTHSAVTTGAAWKFTAPVPGMYHITASTITQSIDKAATESIALRLFLDGAHYSTVGFTQQSITNAADSSAISWYLAGSDTVYLDKDSFVDVRVSELVAAAVNVLNSDKFNFINIYRLP